MSAKIEEAENAGGDETPLAFFFHVQHTNLPRDQLCLNDRCSLGCDAGTCAPTLENTR